MSNKHKSICFCLIFRSNWDLRNSENFTPHFKYTQARGDAFVYNNNNNKQKKNLKNKKWGKKPAGAVSGTIRAICGLMTQSRNFYNFNLHTLTISLCMY